MSNPLHVVAIGGSAGGFQAVRDLAAALGDDFPAAVVVAIHMLSSIWGERAELLPKKSALPAVFADEGTHLHAGRLYVARPDHHLIVNRGHLYVRKGPIENNARPAIDPLFRSVAINYGPRAIAVILSGYASQDGVSGLHAIRRCGGSTIVQDPQDAEFEGMPNEAITFAAPDHVVTLAEMPDLLRRLIAEPKPEPPPVPPDITLEVRIASQDDRDMTAPEKLGKRSNLSCPECHGVLWEIDHSEPVRYRCHVGHAYSGLDLATAQLTEMERALGSALRAINERIALLSRLAEQSRRRQQIHTVRTWESRIDEYRKQADMIRNLLLSRPPDIAVEPGSSQG